MVATINGMHRGIHVPFIEHTVLFFTGISLIALLFWFVQPQYVDVVQEQYGERSVGTLPFLERDAPAGQRTVHFQIILSPIHPTLFQVIPDDCVESLSVNGQPVTEHPLPICDIDVGGTVDLTSVLHTGSNTVVLLLKNHGGTIALRIRPSRTDPLILVLSFSLMAIMVWYVSVSLVHFKRSVFLPMAFALLAGIVIRGGYLLATPSWVRGHDTDSHIEYMRYITDHLALPTFHDSWESYQPPLYYLISALWMAVSDFWGFGQGTRLLGLQLAGFAMSIGVLFISAWIACMLFPLHGKRALADRSAFLMAVAVYPGLVFFAARINNDVLYHLLAFTALGVLLYWWQTGRSVAWYAACALIGLGILTKMNALLLVPVVFGCLLFRRPLRWRRTLVHGVAGGFLILLLSGWFLAGRASEVSDIGTFVVGNVGNLQSNLRVPNTAGALLTFNPVGILRHPFNNPWDDRERRQYLWEYFFRSSLFGEFSFPNRGLAIVLLLLTLAFLPFAAAGFLRDVLERGRYWFPMMLVSFFMVAGHVANRFFNAFATSQDFRYSPLLLVPLFYYGIRGIGWLPESLRITARVFFSFFIFAAAAFFLHLYLPA